jgi:ADP-ribosylglycohydrolase
MIRILMEGLAAGDALGVTSEFLSLEEVRTLYLLNKSSGWPFEPIGGGPFGFRARRPTDDAEMALAIVKAWVESVEGCGDFPGVFDGERIAKHFVQWLDSKPRDIGIATRVTLSAVRAGTPWHRGGYEFWRNNRQAWSNGSLMRNGVVAAMAKDEYQAFRHSLYHGLITHWAPLPAICCAAQTWLIVNGAELLEEDSSSLYLKDNWREDFRRAWNFWLCTDQDPIVREWCDATWDDHEEAWSIFMAADFNPDSFRPFAPIEHIGFCLTTLQIGVWSMQWAARDCPYPAEYLPDGFPQEPFQKTGAEVLSWVAMIGRDSDTYGATAGPMIAAIKSLRRSLVETLWAVEELPREIPFPPDSSSPLVLSALLSPIWSERWEALRFTRILQFETGEEFEHYDVLKKIAEPYSMQAYEAAGKRKALAHVTSSFVVVAEFAYSWRGPHEICCDPIPVASRRLKDATKEWLLENLAVAERRRKESFAECCECGKVLPPEYREGEICHRCMEKGGVKF